MWIVIAQIICLLAAALLIAIVYDLDHETPWYIRYGLILLSGAFIAVSGASAKNREVYTHAAAIAFTSLAVMIVVITGYLIAIKHIKPIVAKIAFGIFGVSVLLWVVGSCSDIKRQELQMKEADRDTLHVAPSEQEKSDEKKWYQL